jgi:hypothetical protein
MYGLFQFAPQVAGAGWLARRRDRNPVGWAVLTLVTAFTGWLIGWAVSTFLVEPDGPLQTNYVLRTVCRLGGMTLGAGVSYALLLALPSRRNLDDRLAEHVAAKGFRPPPDWR